jgi:hypothetical protein
MTDHREVVAILNALPDIVWDLGDQTKIADLCIGRAEGYEWSRITVEIAANHESQVVGCEVVDWNASAYEQGPHV